MPHVFARSRRQRIEQDATATATRKVLQRLDRPAKRLRLRRPFFSQDLPAIEEIRRGPAESEIRCNSKRGTCPVSAKCLAKECAEAGILRGRERRWPDRDLANQRQHRGRCENSSATAFVRIEMASAPPQGARNGKIARAHANRSRGRSHIRRSSTSRRRMRQSPQSE